MRNRAIVRFCVSGVIRQRADNWCCFWWSFVYVRWVFPSTLCASECIMCFMCISWVSAIRVNASANRLVLICQLLIWTHIRQVTRPNTLGVCLNSTPMHFKMKPWRSPTQSSGFRQRDPFRRGHLKNSWHSPPATHLGEAGAAQECFCFGRLEWCHVANYLIKLNLFNFSKKCDTSRTGSRTTETHTWSSIMHLKPFSTKSNINMEFNLTL